MAERKLVAGAVAIVLLFGLATLFWFAQVYWVARPSVKLLDAPATEFSATRAEAVLARILGAERPHPVSTDENAAVRARIVREFAVLGIHTTVYHGFGCNAVRAFGAITCASVNDVLGEVKPGTGKAIVMMAHYDSVPAGPGAADDECDVATILEAARALQARGLASKHPVLALITDGEEAGLLGAGAFLHDPALRARVGAVINVEARGNHGRSLLFQTSPGDGPLIDLYAQSVPNYAASSLYAEIYRLLPNDTDLTLFIRQGLPSFNFAFSENVAHYHTALDTRAHLDPQSLQQQGDNLLGLASGLEQAEFAGLRGSNDIYVDILGRALPRMPASWALPLSLLVCALLLIAAFLGRGASIGTARRLAAFAVTPALLVGAGLLGWLLHAVASAVSGMPDPSYAHPTALRVALSLGIVVTTLLVSRLAPARAIAAAVWLWTSGLGIVAAMFVPGFSPYFLFPSLIAAALLLLSLVSRDGWEGRFGQVALLLSALPTLLLWVGFGAAGETIMGLRLHPLFTIPIAFGLSALTPLFASCALPRVYWAGATATAFVAALALSVFAGMQPAYSEIAPQRLNVTYVEDGKRALWALDALAPVPASMRAVARFDPKPERISPFAWSTAYTASAPQAGFPLPTTGIVADQATNGGRRLTIVLHGSNAANQMALILTKPVGLETIDIKDWHFETPPAWAKLDRVVIGCMSRDCASVDLTLTLAKDASIDAILAEDRFELPSIAAPLLHARPKTATQSQNGDGTLLINHVRLAGRWRTRITHPHPSRTLRSPGCIETGVPASCP